MRRWNVPVAVAYVTALSLVFGGTPLSAASEEAKVAVDLDPSEKAWLEEHRNIRLAVDIDWAPFEFVDSEKRYRGMAADYIALLAKRLGVTFNIDKERPWSEMVRAVRNRDLDAFSLVVKTPQRLEFVNFTNPYISFPMVIVTRDTEPFIDGLSDLRGRSVGVVKSYATHDLLSRNHPEISLVTPDTLRAGLEAVSNGRIYAFVDNVATVGQVIRELGLSNLKISGQTPYRFELSMAVRKDWPELIPILQKALDTVSGAERDEIYNRWIRVKYQEEVDLRIVFLLFAAATVTVLIFVLWNRQLKGQIRRRQDVERALRKSEMRFRSLVEAAPVCIHEIDRGGRLISMNRAGLQMMGVNEESEVCGLQYLDVPIESDRKRIGDLMNAGFQGESSIFEFAAQGPQGLIHFQSCFAPVVNEHGEIDHLMGVTQDVSKRKSAELDREEALNEAKNANKAKSDFLATMSHELRTPLNAILGFAQVIGNEVVGPVGDRKYLEYAHDIEASGRHLLAIVNDVLDLSKIEAGEFQTNPTTFALKPALMDSVSLVAFKGGRAPDTIDIDIAEDASELYADLRSFRQIVINLMSNADKYSPSSEPISLSAVRDGDGAVVVKIMDRGVGIPEEDFERVLEPFGQARENSEVTHEGTGIGLSLSKKLMEIQKGSLTLESRVGQGTTVTLTFPGRPS